MVKLLVANPTAVHVEANTADYVVSGTRPEQVTAGIDDDTTFDDVVERAAALPGEFSVLCVDDEVVRAYRSVTSSYDVFFTRLPDDDTIVVVDYFRDVLS